MAQHGVLVAPADIALVRDSCKQLAVHACKLAFELHRHVSCTNAFVARCQCDSELAAIAATLPFSHD